MPHTTKFKKEAKEDDAWILDMYDAYLEQQAVQ